MNSKHFESFIVAKCDANNFGILILHIKKVLHKLQWIFQLLWISYKLLTCVR